MTELGRLHALLAIAMVDLRKEWEPAWRKARKLATRWLVFFPALGLAYVFWFVVLGSALSFLLALFHFGLPLLLAMAGYQRITRHMKWREWEWIA